MAAGSSLRFPFSENFASDFSMPAKPLSKNLCSTSRTVTSNPAVALTCAMPDPMRPQPTTPTFLISISPQRTQRITQDTCNLVWVILFEAFDDNRDALATTDTGGCEAMFLVSAFQFV